jgi:hypothetical protein
MKKSVPLILLVLIAVVAHSQSRLTLSAPDSLAFRFALDGQEVSSALLSSLTLPGVPAGKRTIRMSFGDGSAHEQALTLKDRIHYTYEFRQTRAGWRLQILSEVAWTPSSPSGIAVSAASDSVSVLSETSETGGDEGGCTPPVSEARFEQLRTELSQIAFESRKLEAMRKFVLAECIRTDQLRYLLAQLSMEDYKLKLLEDARTRVFDPSRLARVLDDFYLEKNREKARLLLAE